MPPFLGIGSYSSLLHKLLYTFLNGETGSDGDRAATYFSDCVFACFDKNTQSLSKHQKQTSDAFKKKKRQHQHVSTIIERLDY